MNKARRSPFNTAAAHVILLSYTLIALFPVFVILINSFKTRKAIFREPLSLPSSETFSTVGYETVFKQGDFFLYFQNSMIVTVAFAKPFRIAIRAAAPFFSSSRMRSKISTLASTDIPTVSTRPASPGRVNG